MDKKEVRALFPLCCEFADLVRNEFGDGVKMVYAEENESKIGKQSSDGIKVADCVVRGDAYCVDKPAKGNKG